jgi:hypothetical protein
MTAEIVRLIPEPTVTERYAHLRENAEAFVESMKVMVRAAEREGDLDLATKLRVWCLMPWRSALADDASGDLWWTCEACEKPIKDGTEVATEDGCWLHKSCVGT